MLDLIRTLDDGIHRFNQVLGKVISWFIGIMVVLVIFIVAARAMFNAGSVAIQEVVNYLHATVFLVLLTYTAQDDRHVRVDVFYRDFSAITKSWVNAIGAVVLLIPFSVFLIVISWNFVLNSWEIKEGSSNPGGLDGVYLLKTLIPISATLLGIHGISQAVREIINISFITKTKKQNQ